LIFQVYTDGSCNPQKNIGAWAAIIFFDNEKIVIQGKEKKTTHQRMELSAVISALEFINKKIDASEKSVQIYSDSQYVIGLENRFKKLQKNNFLTAKGIPIANSDFVQTFFQLMNKLDIQFIKVKAHLKNTDQINYNREVDMLVRQMVRKN